jgi:hypothetical protein
LDATLDHEALDCSRTANLDPLRGSPHCIHVGTTVLLRNGPKHLANLLVLTTVDPEDTAIAVEHFDRIERRDSQSPTESPEVYLDHLAEQAYDKDLRACSPRSLR